MTITDPIGDLLTRIRNGQRAFKKTVCSPHSFERENLLKALLEEGYIRHYSVKEEINGRKQLTVELKYYDGKSVIQSIQRVSTPGRRVYSKIKALPKIANGLGISILSTNRGILSDVKAKELGVGGEVLCSVF